MSVIANPRHGPVGAALCDIVRLSMKVVLHLGAHRTASTSFQAYLNHNVDELSCWGVGVWGPRRTRKGLLSGVMPRMGFGAEVEQFRRARGRIMMHLDQEAQLGRNTLVVSDENMIGTTRDNLRRGLLYAGIGERMARYAAAFGERLSHVILSVRSLDQYWASAAAFGTGRGHPLQDEDKWAGIATSRRGWRGVITDLACALPDIDIHVMPFEHFAGRPDQMLGIGVDCIAPEKGCDTWLNNAPRLEDLRPLLAERGDRAAALPRGTGRWMPFTAEQRAALKMRYAEDMSWLRAGADGLATLKQDPDREKAGKTADVIHPNMTDRGRPHGFEERQMARPG
ncbi:MAG: hypothetical protein AAGG57_20765 [Pseudomonadota bacterium]